MEVGREGGREGGDVLVVVAVVGFEGKGKDKDEWMWR